MMTPALGFFYGGMVRAKNALNTLMMSFSALGFVGMAWALFGYSWAFGRGAQYFFLRGVGLDAKGTIPHILFFSYQGTFAIITAALISGAIVERMRFGPYLLFLTSWALLVYAPLAHSVWGGGWLARLGALDFAGGTVVHVNAAAAAGVAAWVLGPRKDHARQAMLPHNVPFTLLGAGLLWFGWFGFNAGSALGANASAALAFTNTNTAAAAALVTWVCLDLARGGKATAVGAATGLVVGLVGITPAAGYITVPASIAVGVLAVIVSYTAIQIRATTRLDDSLDVFSCHGLAGRAGALLTGVFATKVATPAGGDGWLAGNFAQMGIQLVAVLAAVAIAALGTALIMVFVNATLGAKAGVKEQLSGLDLSEHGEEAYFGEQGATPAPGLSLGAAVIVSGVPAKVEAA